MEHREPEHKYEVQVTDRKTGRSVVIDAYDMIEALDIKCPALQHAFKKIAFTGKRGHKDTMEDLEDIQSSIEAAIQLEVYRS